VTHDEEIRRGNEAQRVLDEPMLKDAFATVETAIIDALKVSKLIDREQDRELVLQLKALALVRSHIVQHVHTGKLASIAKQESMAQRMLRRLK
jgi:hypothetical protein